MHSVLGWERTPVIQIQGSFFDGEEKEMMKVF